MKYFLYILLSRCIFVFNLSKDISKKVYMLSADRKRIEIFREGISINQTLTKSTRPLVEMGMTEGGVSFATNDTVFNFGDIAVSGGSKSIRTEVKKDVWDGLNFPIKTQFKNKMHHNFYKSYLKIKRRFSKKKLNPTEFFKELKLNSDGFGDLENQLNIVDDYINVLKESGQQDLRGKFITKRNIIVAEIKLRDGGFDQILTENNLVKFVLKSCRGLKLDYLLDFDRIIPKDVVESKNKAEEIGMFDNYVILHYDPDAAELLKKEVLATEEKKDPILFGLIKGSTNLYFIDDWIDEKCDLTYSKIINTIGEDEKLV